VTTTAVLGPGALGGLLAALFFEAGEEVCLVDYRPERVEALQREGLLLQDLDGHRRRLAIPVVLPEHLGPCPLTLVTVKAHQTRAAARSLPLLLSGGGLALTLQNGLGNLETLAAAAGPERLLAGVIFAGATRPRHGQVIYAGIGDTYIGAPPGSRVTPGEMASVAARFRRAGLKCQVREDIEVMLWEKLLVNVGINPLTAILRVRNGDLLKVPDAWELAVAAAREAQAVAQSYGVAVGQGVEERLRSVCTATAGNRSSMLQDILAGRTTEIEALNAQVVSRGAAHGVPTPVNHFLTRLLRALQHAPSQLPS